MQRIDEEVSISRRPRSSGTQICAFTMPVLRSAITRMRRSELGGAKSKARLSDLLEDHGADASGSKPELAQRWRQVSKEQHPPVTKMKSGAIIRYMYRTASELGWDYSTVLKGPVGVKKVISKTCQEAVRAGRRVKEAPAEIIPKDRLPSTYNQFVSQMFKKIESDAAYAQIKQRYKSAPERMSWIARAAWPRHKRQLAQAAQDSEARDLQRELDREATQKLPKRIPRKSQRKTARQQAADERAQMALLGLPQQFGRQ